MDNLPSLIAVLVPAIFAVTVHEVAHGWVANRCGDPTAAEQGRLSLNPLRHVDLIGTILVPAAFYFSSVGVFFGWAKPVPVEWRRLRKPRRDIAMVAAAGPGVNLVMFIAWLGAYYLLQTTGSSENLLDMCEVGIKINAVIMLINLVPIPPLDGSRIVTSILPARAAYFYNRIEPYGLVLLVALLLTGVLSMIFNPVIAWVEHLIS